MRHRGAVRCLRLHLGPIRCAKGRADVPSYILHLTNNYAVKIGRAKKKIYSTEPYNYSLENFAIPQLGRKISPVRERKNSLENYFTDELPDIYGNANRPLSYRLRAVKVQFLCRYRVGFV